LFNLIFRKTTFICFK